VADRKNVIIDGTGKNVPKYVDKIAALKKAGYRVRVLMPHVDAETAWQRSKIRAEKTGRKVPEELVRNAHAVIPKNFERIARQAHDFALFDSRQGHRPVWSGQEGKEDTIHDSEFVNAFRKQHTMSKAMNAGDKKPELPEPKREPSDSMEDMLKRIRDTPPGPEDWDDDGTGGNANGKPDAPDEGGMWWPVQDYEEEIREQMEQEHRKRTQPGKKPSKGAKSKEDNTKRKPLVRKDLGKALAPNARFIIPLGSLR
jgi:hypothetical protein